MNTTHPSGAYFDATAKHRLRLWREWDANDPVMVFIGLNPSTADAERDDPTIRRCIGFAKREGAGRLEMLNLYSLRTPSPRVLRASTHRLHPQIDEVMRDVLCWPRVKWVVAAWGVLTDAEREREAAVKKLAGTMSCLGTTQGGFPRHPLYLPRDSALTQFDASEKPQD